MSIRNLARCLVYVVVAGFFAATPVARAVLAHWKLEGTVYDSSDNARDGTPGGTPAYAAAVAGNGISLNEGVAGGTGTDTAVIPDSTDLDFSNRNFSVSFWVNKRQLSGSGATGHPWYHSAGVTKWVSGGGGEWAIFLSGNVGETPQFTIVSGGSEYTSQGVTALSTQVFHHIVAVRDGGWSRLYLDNSLNASNNIGAIAVDNQGNDLPVMIGGWNNSTFGAADAIFDDVQIYNRALTTSDVDFLYNNPGETPSGETNLVGYWKLDGMLDASGHGHHGATYGDPSHTAGVDGDGIRVNHGAVNAYVEIPDAADFDFGSDDFGVSFWVNKLELSYPQPEGHPWSNSFAVVKWATHEWAVFISSGVAEHPAFWLTSGAVDQQLNSPNTISTQVFHHVVATREGEWMKLYLDGSLDCSTNIGTIAVDNAGDVPIWIGAGAWTGAGAIFDELQIYDKALTEYDVGFLYSNPGETVPDFRGTMLLIR